MIASKKLMTTMLAAGLIVGLGAATAQAGSLKVSGDVDDTINFRVGNGGEFRMNWVNGDTGFTLAGDPAGVNDFGTYLQGGWQTFCVEHDESIALGGVYDYTVDTFIKHQTGNRTLSAGTAYLYTEFWNGTLAQGTSDAYEYDYTLTTAGNREDSARALQLAIWALQGFNLSEYSTNALAQSYYQLATTAVADDSIWGNTIGNVRVVNLFSGTDQKQSQLVVVPLPPAAFAGLAMLGGLGLLRLRRRRRR